MPLITSRPCLFLLLFPALAAAPLALAGPIDPPPGPVAPTHKTLTQLEPRTPISAATTPGDNDLTPSLYKITQPGSYYLTGNITGVAGKHGIEIAAPGVTLDLMGFQIAGVPGSRYGVNGASTAVGVTVRNGSVTGCEFGVFLAGEGGIIESLRAFANSHTGIYLIADGTVRGCTASSNGAFGIITLRGGLIDSCLVVENGSSGISTSAGTTIRSCTANDNGERGISSGQGTTIDGCTARRNADFGINASAGSVITGCAATDNGAAGISLFDGLVARCTAEGNSGHGIRLNNNCTALDNHSAGHATGAGLFCAGDNNRIEGNSFIGNAQGINVTAAGNLILRNTCADNATNWTIVAGNAVARIVQATTNAATITGSTYTGSLGSTDPTANFSY